MQGAGCFALGVIFDRGRDRGVVCVFCIFGRGPVTVSMRSRALMKMLNSCGDVILPCATPVLKVIVALSSSFGASLTVAPLYICSKTVTYVKIHAF